MESLIDQSIKFEDDTVPLGASLQATPPQMLGIRSGKNYHPPKFFCPPAHLPLSSVVDTQSNSPKTFPSIAHHKVSDMRFPVRHILTHEETQHPHPSIARHTDMHEDYGGAMNPPLREQPWLASENQCRTRPVTFYTGAEIYPPIIDEEPCNSTRAGQESRLDGCNRMHTSTPVTSPSPEMQPKDMDKLNILEDKITSLTDAVSKLAVFV